jgi:hypothetical protein
MFNYCSKIEKLFINQEAENLIITEVESKKPQK